MYVLLTPIYLYALPICFVLLPVDMCVRGGMGVYVYFPVLLCISLCFWFGLISVLRPFNTF